MSTADRSEHMTYVALLHSVGIGGGGRLRMSDWRHAMESAGLRNPRTLGATGNALFEGRRTSIETLTRHLERAFALAFGRHVDIILRDAGGWRRLAERNPFPAESRRAAANVLVRVMRSPLDPDVAAGLLRRARQGECLRVVAGDLWIHFGQPPNQSRLLSALTTQRLGVGTLRNWNTVRRLHEMLAKT